MGLIVSRFKRRKSTAQLLRTIQKELDGIEQYYRDEESGRRRSLTVRYFILFCFVGWLLFYFFLPADLYSRLFYATLLCLPLPMMFMTKRVLAFYHGKKMKRKDDRRAVLLKEKKSLLDQVQENETYRVAKQILEEFAPELLRRSPLRPQAAENNSVSQTASTVRQRSSTALQPIPAPANSQALSLVSPVSPVQQRLNQHRQAMMSAHLMPSTPNAPSHIRPRSPLPRPILNRERGYLDRVMDALVGDGPSNRYALICSQCHGHNGMALREEFQYLAFRCCYCHGWNPSRKQRPSAPRLPTPGHIHTDSSTDTDQSGSSDSEDDHAPKPITASVLGNSPALPIRDIPDSSDTSEAEQRGEEGNDRVEESVAASDASHTGIGDGGDVAASDASHTGIGDVDGHGRATPDQSASQPDEAGESQSSTAQAETNPDEVPCDDIYNNTDQCENSAASGFEPPTDDADFSAEDINENNQATAVAEEITCVKASFTDDSKVDGARGECCADSCGNGNAGSLYVDNRQPDRDDSVSTGSTMAESSNRPSNASGDTTTIS